MRPHCPGLAQSERSRISPRVRRRGYPTGGVESRSTGFRACNDAARPARVKTCRSAFARRQERGGGRTVQHLSREILDPLSRKRAAREAGSSCARDALATSIAAQTSSDAVRVASGGCTLRLLHPLRIRESSWEGEAPAEPKYEARQEPRPPENLSKRCSRADRSVVEEGSRQKGGQSPFLRNLLIRFREHSRSVVEEGSLPANSDETCRIAFANPTGAWWRKARCRSFARFSRIPASARRLT